VSRKVPSISKLNIILIKTHVSNKSIQNQEFLTVDAKRVFNALALCVMEVGWVETSQGNTMTCEELCLCPSPESRVPAVITRSSPGWDGSEEGAGT
jgi:hypothetical protein